MIDTAEMYNRKAAKLEKLQKSYHNQVHDRYKIQHQDDQLIHYRQQQWQVNKDIEEINRYMALSKRVEYALYQYARYLGKHIDIMV